MKIASTIFLLIGTAVFSLLAARDAASQQGREAHSHGEGHITLIYERGQLLVEMSTPAVNILGFEHLPTSDKQWQALEVARQKLQYPKGLISLEPKCELKSSSVDLPFKRAKPHKADSEHVHQDHSDISSRYMWHCGKFDLPKLWLHYFDVYPGFDTIIVEWIVNGSQGLNRLSKRENTLEIAQ